MPTTSLGLRYPALSAAPNVPQDIGNLAADVNALLVTIKASYEGAWPTYPVVWSSTGTAPATGNGTLTGNYKQVGNTVHVRIALTLGTTSTVGTGAYRFTLPVAPKVGQLLLAMFKDASAGSARYSGAVELTAATTGGDNMRINVSGNTGVVGNTIPVVPANGDELFISGVYEAA